MFKSVLKIIIFLIIFPLIGFGVSSGFSYLENNILFESYILYLSNKNKTNIQDNLIFDSIAYKEGAPIDAEEEIINYGIPTSIYIENVNINLEIKEGQYDYGNQTWSLTNGYAYWANLSDPIKSKNSNTVIYAHNQINEFYKTKGLKVGDNIIIETSENYKITFQYVDDKIVLPEEGDILFQKDDDSKLTLITCSGLFSEKRRIMYAKMTTNYEKRKDISINLAYYMEIINKGKDMTKINPISRLYSDN